ncbi:MAG: CopG family transcriptional regulator [Planctomycetota bacterium]
MKTAISISDDLFRAAERAAKRLGLSRSELYRRALSAFLERHADKLVTQALDGIYAEGSGSGSVDPVLEQMQIASLPEDEW